MDNFKLLLIDKDQTLIRSRLGAREYIQSPWDQMPIAGIAEKLDRYSADDWIACIISNQGGIDKGHKSLESTFLEFRYCLELFPQIGEAYFCPNFSGSECWRIWGDCKEDHRILYRDGNYRKPAPGMLKLAIANHGADEALYVGDRPEDDGAAAATGLPFIWANDFLRD